VRRAIAVVGLLALALAGAVYLVGRPAPPPPAAEPGSAPATLPTTQLPTAAPPLPEPATPAPEEPVLPPLAESDPVVRELAARLSSQPRLTAALATPDVIRRFVAAVDNVADGEVPRVQLPALAPTGEFRVEERPDGTWIDPRSYARYDGVGDLVGSIDAAGSAELYHRLAPLLDTAYGELGYPDRRFDDRLRAALVRLLGTPLLEGRVAVTPRVLTWRFADPALERLSPVQKQLVRLGPRNERLVQQKLREIAEALGIPPSELPPEVVQP
jgi:DUF3014 family protein